MKQTWSRSGLAVVMLVLVGAANPSAQEPPPEGVGGLPNPILFVTQFPIAQDFATIGSVFANHRADVGSAGRGGDLWIAYPDGSLRNLTAEAGYGMVGFQGEDSIAVRNPSVHWSGTRAVFSMVVGAAAQQFQVVETRWQLYEVTGLGQGEPATITLVPGQPESYNNIMPTYGTDGRILFVSDRPRDGAAHLYPQHDEYESTPTPTGIWSLDPSDGDLFLLQHSPSGSFTPIVDSAGRVVFTRWDHLQRDQQADADELSSTTVYGTFDYSDESADAIPLDVRHEVFPEPRPVRTDLLAGTNLEGHRINHFFPWFVEEDGRGEEVLIHLGRHELHDYFNRSMNDDANLEEFIASVSGRVNPRSVENLLFVREDPMVAGTFVAVDAPEFQTHASGMVVALSAPEGDNPDSVVVEYLTHPSTRTVVPDGDPPPADHSGHYRGPLVLSDGSLWASHTYETRVAGNDGTVTNPAPRYDFRLRRLTNAANGYLEAGTALTSGIVESVTFWSPDQLISYTGELWELDAVEVRSRPLPPIRPDVLPSPEAQIFTEENVDPAAFRADLEARGLAVFTARDVTSRDGGDRQQPFNLEVTGGGKQTLGAGGEIYELAYLQFFQADQLRGIGGIDSPRPGRRPIARVMHDSAAQALNEQPPGAPAGSVAIAPDGSAAAFVPARRAMAWHTTEPDGTPVVRERYWITFQPGEVRTCDGCHGVNTVNQAGLPPADNPPEALRLLLRRWKLLAGFLFADGFESGDTAAWAATQP